MRGIKSWNFYRSHIFNSFLRRLHTNNGIPMRYNNKFVNTSLTKMNRIMIDFFKQPNMYIKRDNNIIPFRFFTKDKIILNGIQYITNKQSTKWIVTTHDFGQNKFWALFYARPFIELGYNILAFDFRNHGDNKDIEPVSLGALETLDLESAISWLTKNKNPSFIGLNGKGLGAYTINNLYYQKPEFFKENNIKYCVCESTYVSSESLILNSFTKTHYINKKAYNTYIRYQAKEIIKVAQLEEEIDLTKNNLLKAIQNNKENIVKNYVPFMYTTSVVKNAVTASDSYELITARDIFRQSQNQDKIVMYDFGESGLLFKDHFKKNFREIVDFENKIIGNQEQTDSAISKIQLTDEDIATSKEEKDELTTFVYNR